MTKSTCLALVTVIVAGTFAVAGSVRADSAKQFSGIASHYSKGYKGKTASGQIYDPGKLTAAHRTLPFGTKVVVTDLHSKKTVTVVVNDRGPFVKGRVIDLSYSAAEILKMPGRGLTKVTAIAE